MVKHRIYVGCALTNAPEVFRESVEAFKQSLQPAFEVQEFVGLVGGTAAEVYRHDVYECVDKSEAMIGVCDYPATGLGGEIMRCVDSKKPLLLLSERGRHISRFVIGMAAVEPNVTIHRYTELADSLPFATGWLNDILQRSKKHN